MNQKELLNLLTTIENKKYIGISSIDLVQFAIDKDLIERTPVGNFQLTTKGSGLLKKELSWDEI